MRFLRACTPLLAAAILSMQLLPVSASHGAASSNANAPLLGGSKDAIDVASLSPTDLTRSAVAPAAATSRVADVAGTWTKLVTKVSGGGEASNTAGVLAVLGGALCHLALGSVYCWGNFLPYAPASIKYFDGVGKEGAQPDALWVLPVGMIFQCLTMPIGPYFQKRIGCGKTTLLGCWMMAAGVYLSSYAPNLVTFMLAYSGLFGGGVGIAYTAPMVNGWRWFPKNKGLASGAVVAGFGGGGFIFNQIGTRLINPDGLDAVAGVYPDSIYSAFPGMLRKLALCYAVLCGFGSMLIRAPSDGVSKATAMSKDKKATPGFTVREALRGKTFYLLWTLALLSACSGLNIAGVYKSFANTVDELKSDSFLALVGSIGALFNAAGRLFWGGMIDTNGFKGPFGVLVAIQVVTMASYTALSSSRTLYMMATCAIFFCLGGNFAMFPAVTSRVFGSENGATIYGILFSAFGMASTSGTVLTKALQAQFGWNGVFRVMSAMSTVVLLLLAISRKRLP